MFNKSILGLLLLSALMISCGGGSQGGNGSPIDNTPKASNKLEYIDPVTSTSHWRLVKGQGTTETEVRLYLIGPAKQKARGIAHSATVDSTYSFNTYFYTDSDSVGGTNQKGSTLFLGKFAPSAIPFAVDSPIYMVTISVPPTIPKQLPLAVSTVKFVDESGNIQEATIDLGILKVIP